MIKIFLVLLVFVFAAAATKSETSGVDRRLLSNSSRRNLGVCQDNLRFKDSYGDTCEDYKGNSHWCGNYDNQDFKSNALCCACGGGKRKDNLGYTCTTGSGSFCKTCVAPPSMTTNNHCATCNSGYEISGTGCKPRASLSRYNCQAKKCVNGQNIGYYKNKSREECAQLCNAHSGCEAFEYGVNHGGAGHYEPRDCQLNRSSNSYGCPGGFHNLDLCIKQ